MFSHIFFWCFLIHSVCMTAFKNGSKALNMQHPNSILTFVTNTYVILGTISSILFIVLGFFYMPAWWYPLALIGFSILLNITPFLDLLGSILGWVLIPICGILMYLDMFGLINIVTA